MSSLAGTRMQRANRSCRIFFLGIFAMTAYHDQLTAQEPATTPTPSAGLCIRCHSKSENTAQVLPRALELIRLDEATTWDENDYHRLAYLALTSERGRQMGKMLGNKDVTKMMECLTCHAVDPRPNGTKANATEFNTEHGVSCLACHSTDESVGGRWRSFHFDEVENWRAVKPKDKRQHGQRDLRDPIARAELCVNCHIGNLQQGRFVTHDMYAAGHPPLRGIEVMAYSRDQQMHYDRPKDSRYITKLAEEEPTKALERFHFRPGEDHDARQLAVGAIVSMRESTRLISAASKNLNPKKPTLDYAHFDCYSCHHDLGGTKWRQQVQTEGKLGRVRPRFWGKPLASIVIEHGNRIDVPPAEFQRKYLALVKELDDHPFGIEFAAEREIPRKADDLISECDKFLKSQLELTYSDQDATRLQQMIVKQLSAAERYGLVPDAAQQLIWAFGVLQADLRTPRTKDEISTRYQKLDDFLPLFVRPAQMLSHKKPNWLATETEKRLVHFADYDPRKLRELMQPFLKADSKP